MLVYNGAYYHIYNRSNAREIIFPAKDSYGRFLKKYRYGLDEYLDTLAYCLMPTHFHLLVRVKTEATVQIGYAFGVLLSSYT